MQRSGSHVYGFGSFVLDVDDRSLKDAGRPIPLTPKLFDLLVALVSNAGRLLEKDALLQAVWPDVAVEEGSLTKGVFGLRQALGQDATTIYIETVPKRGYRFVAPVAPPVSGAPADRISTPDPRRHQIDGPAALDSAPRSIAVLPFADMSESRDQEFLCEGMSEEIINALGRIPGLRVVSYTSSSRFRATHLDAREIGRELSVAWLLEGSVRKAGDTVRIAVQLVRTSDGFTAWSNRFDRQLENVFAVQDEIAGTIALTLTHQVATDTGPLVTSRTSNVEVYSLYLEGRYLWNKRPGKEVWEALDRFERAVSLDPTFAPAHAAIASVYGTLGGWELGAIAPVKAFATVKAAARRALELDPRLAAGHAALGFATLHFDWNPDGACVELEQAIALNPGWVDAHHWQSHALCAAGRFTESLTASRRALDLDPVNPLMHAHLAWHHYMAREFEEALVRAEHLIGIEPGCYWGHLFKAWALERLGRGTEAVDAFRQLIRDFSKVPAMLGGLGHALAAAQDRRAALSVAHDLETLRHEQELHAYELAVIHAALGDGDLAFEWLTRAVQERSGWIAYLRVDPRLDDLRSDPRFAHLSASSCPPAPPSARTGVSRASTDNPRR